MRGGKKNKTSVSVLMSLCQAEKQKGNEGMELGLTQGEILIHGGLIKPLMHTVALGIQGMAKKKKWFLTSTFPLHGTVIYVQLYL